MNEIDSPLMSGIVNVDVLVLEVVLELVLVLVSVELVEVVVDNTITFSTMSVALCSASFPCPDGHVCTFNIYPSRPTNCDVIGRATTASPVWSLLRRIDSSSSTRSSASIWWSVIFMRSTPYNSGDKLSSRVCNTMRIIIGW